MNYEMRPAESEADRKMWKYMKDFLFMFIDNIAIHRRRCLRVGKSYGVTSIPCNVLEEFCFAHKSLQIILHLDWGNKLRAFAFYTRNK